MIKKFNEFVEELEINEDLRDWFGKEKWVS